MMRKKWMIAMFMAAVMLVPIGVSITASAMSNTADTALSEPSENFAFTNKSVKVLTDDSKADRFSNRLAQSTSKISISSDTAKASMVGSDIVIIDQSWLDKADKSVSSSLIEDLIKSHVPVATMSKDPSALIEVLAKNNLPMAQNDGMDANGYFQNATDGRDCSFNLLYDTEGSTTKDTTEMVIGSVYNWGVNMLLGKMELKGQEKMVSSDVSDSATKVSSDSEYKPMVLNDAAETKPMQLDRFVWTSGGNWEAAHYYYFPYQHARGWINMNHAHYKMTNDQQSTYDYWMTDFFLEVVPKWNLGYAIADTVVRGTFAYNSQYNLAYDPDASTGGTGTTTVTVGFGYSSDDNVNIGITAGWEYSVSDAPVNNNCNMLGTRVYDWWTNVNENSMVGKTTYCSNPGMSTRVANGQNFYINENREVTFCHFNGLWMDDFKKCSYNSGMHYYS